MSVGNVYVKATVANVKRAETEYECQFCRLEVDQAKFWMFTDLHRGRFDNGLWSDARLSNRLLVCQYERV